jgi:pilus assembly protein CpaE
MTNMPPTRSGRPVAVAFVTRTAGASAALQTALSGLNLRALIEHVVSGDGAAPTGKSTAVDVVVLDLDLSDAADGPLAERLMTDQFGGAPCLVRTGVATTDAARRFLRLRAAEVVDNTASMEELALAISRTVHATRPGGSNRAIAFFSPRGGVGQSMLAIEAAALIAEAERGRADAVCIVDLNLQFGAIASMTNLDAGFNVPLDELEPERIDAQLLDAFLTTDKHGVSLVAAPPAMQDSDRAPEAIMRLLDFVAARFGTVIFDLPKRNSPIVDAALAGADDVFLTLDLSVPGLRLGRAALGAVTNVAGAAAPIHITLNRVDRQGMGALTIDDARARFPGLPMAVIQEEPETAREALERGAPISRLRPQSRLARDIRTALSALLPDSAPVEPQKSGLFSRFQKR